MTSKSPPTRLMDAESSLFMIRNYGKFYSSSAIARNQIAEEIEAALRFYHKDYSAEEIKARFETLKRTYIKYKQDIVAGKVASIKWTYLEDMDKIMTPSKKTSKGSSKRMRSSSSRTRSASTSEERYIDVTGDDPEEDFLVRKKFKPRNQEEINSAAKSTKSDPSMKTTSWSQCRRMPNQHAAETSADNAANGLQPEHSMSPESPPAAPLPFSMSSDSPAAPSSSPESPEPESSSTPGTLEPESSSPPGTSEQESERESTSQPEPESERESTSQPEQQPEQQPSPSTSHRNGSPHPETPQGIKALMDEVDSIQTARLAINKQRMQIEQEKSNLEDLNFHLTSRFMSVVYKTLKVVSENSP